MQRVVNDVDAVVGTHLQPLAHALDGLLRADRQHGHWALVCAAQAFLDLQRLFDRVLVELVDHGVGRITIEGVVCRIELLLGPRVGHLLHAHDDLHGDERTS